MLQLATATSVLANGGVKNVPHVVRATQDALNHQELPRPVPEALQLGFKPEHLNVVRDGLVGVTTGGTSAQVFAGAAYTSAGKTGTAQAVTIGQKDKYNACKLSEHQRDHALYMAFAPADKPKIALAVIVENAGFGAAHAAPIARRVFDYWLLDSTPVQRTSPPPRTGKPVAQWAHHVRRTTCPSRPDRGRHHQPKRRPSCTKALFAPRLPRANPK